MVTRTILLASALAPALMLAACGGTPNRGLESVHQPVVSRSDYVFDVDTSGDGLAPGERQRLAAWMSSLRLGYGDTVSVDDPGSRGPGVRDDVAAEVAPYGLMLSNAAPVTDLALAPGTARVVVTRLKASVPGCPDFSRTRQPEFNSNTSSNQGCAINANLAAMVANPGDLVRGQSGDGVNDPALGGRAIDAYRTNRPTGADGLKDPGAIKQ